MSNIMLVPFSKQDLRSLSVKNEVERIYNLIISSANNDLNWCNFQIKAIRFYNVLRELYKLFPDVDFTENTVIHGVISYKAYWGEGPKLPKLK